MQRHIPKTFLLPILLTLPVFAQFDGPPATLPAPAPNLHIIEPTVDKATSTITLPAAFWNQKLAGWIEVAICGRASDFLHETVIAVSTTKALLRQSMRDAGFRDADQWAPSVLDFAQIRGDRALVTLIFTQNGKQQTVALDETIAFMGWGVSAGPYGWMFKGDPQHTDAQNEKQLNATTEPDSVKMIRDDPQAALAFKGLQHMTQSFLDYPLAYDDWIYPDPQLARNPSLLPQEVYDSNGSVDVVLTIRKVSEEQFLTELARIWHDENFRPLLTANIPIARQIDADKEAYFTLFRQIRTADPSDPALAKKWQLQFALLQSAIAANYATLDAAWADYACDHPAFLVKEVADLAELQAQAKLWREHMDLQRDAARQKHIAAQAALDVLSAPDEHARQKLFGIQLEAESRALVAQNKQSRDYWTAQLNRLQPDDPRTAWIDSVKISVHLANARDQLAQAGIAAGQSQQSPAPPSPDPALAQYTQLKTLVHIDELKLDLLNLSFEIEKREGLDNDPDLPKLKQKKQEIEAELQSLQSTAQPATQGK